MKLVAKMKMCHNITSENMFNVSFHTIHGKFPPENCNFEFSQTARAACVCSPIHHQLVNIDSASHFTMQSRPSPHLRRLPSRSTTFTGYGYRPNCSNIFRQVDNHRPAFVATVMYVAEVVRHRMCVSTNDSYAWRHDYIVFFRFCEATVGNS